MTKIKQNRILLILASLVGGVGLGVLISFFVFPMNGADTSDSPLQTIQESPSANSNEQESLANVSTDLEEIIVLEMASERRGALYQLLEQRSGDQVAELLRQSLSFDYTKNLYSVQRLLFAELARIDPEKSLNLVWETAPTRWSTFLNIVAMHWGMVSPEEALQTFSSLDEPWKSQAITTVFQTQGTLSDAQVAETAESFHFTDHLATWKYDVQIEEAIEEPRKAFSLALLADTTESHRTRMLTHITSRWLEREGIEDLPSMLSLVYDVFVDTRFLWNPVIEEIAASDPEYVWLQLSSMPIETQKLFTKGVFRRWVDHDPMTAFQTVTTQEYLDANEADFYSLLSSWVRAIADRFLENFELVPTNWKNSAINIAVDHLTENSSPSQVVQLLTQLKSMGYDTTEAAESFVRSWSFEDPIAAIDWALENLDQESYSGQSSTSFILGRIALTNLEKAVEIALEQPEDTALEWGIAMTLLRQGQFDRALSLLPKLRGSSDSAFSYNGFSLLLFQAGRVDDVLALSDQLDESQKPFFYRNTARHWVRFEPESLLKRLPKLPTVEMQRSIAQGVLSAQESYPYLTEEELELVQSFVSDETN